MIDFRIKAMTFDNVPWMITMKKNEHYFPTMEWIKDASAPNGWKRVTYEDNKVHEGEPSEGLLPLAGEDNGDVEEAVGGI